MRTIEIEVTHIETKLYIVEGPPRTGKSDAARFLTELLANRGRQASLYDEDTTDHPADYTFHAYMTEAELGGLSPEERNQIYSESTKAGPGYIIPMTKLSISLFGKVLPHKIYDHLAWEKERPLMLGYWRSFAEKARMDDGVNVFVGNLLKNPVCETMIRYDFPFSEIGAFVREIFGFIAPLDPVVVYLSCGDIAACVEERVRNRKTAWLNSAVTYHDAQCYSRRRGLSGFDGLITCLQARQKMELDILDSLPVQRLILTDAHLDWDGACDKIASFVTGKTPLAH